jgi:hypothetical protein
MTPDPCRAIRDFENADDAIRLEGRHARLDPPSEGMPDDAALMNHLKTDHIGRPVKQSTICIPLRHIDPAFPASRYLPGRAGAVKRAATWQRNQWCSSFATAGV